MSKAAGFALILSGLTVAAYMLPESNTAEPEIAGSRTDIAKSAPSQIIIAPEPKPAFRPVRTAEAAASLPVVVTVAPRPSEGPMPQRVIPRDRDALARELQKELRRVGCYDGELNGAWTPATRRAMKAFVDRANASLPVDEPDPILYAMVQSQAEPMCGRPCPTGQGFSEDGRCVPAAILAKASKKAGPQPASVATAAHRPPAEQKPAPVIPGWSTTSTPAAPASIASAPADTIAPRLGPPPAEGRMALAGPATEDTPPNPASDATPPPAPPQVAKPAPPKPVKAKSSWAAQVLARRDSQN